MSGESGDNNKKMDVTPDKDGGVLKEILVEGKGDASPPKGVKVIVHYVGKLTDGKKFDSSRDRGEPFEFTLGRGNVIRGWDVGVATMKKGEKSLLTCREDYAYGVTGSPPNIPPKATLVFEVELLNWEAEDLSGKSDRGILRHPIEAGTGVDSPKDLATVDVTLVGTLPDGKEFFNKRISFCLGEGIKQDIPRGVEKALKKMVTKEKSKIDLKPNYAWGGVGNTQLGVPPDTSVSYIITLHSFEIIKDTWAMNSTEKLDRALKLKEKGTKYFKDGDLSLAVKMYTKLVDIAEFDGGFDGSEEDERKKLLLAGYLNLSMCYLKMENAVMCKDMCNKALEQDPKSVKALFRRGQAYLAIKEPKLAIKDFKAVLEIEPENKAAIGQVALCQQKAREIKENEKKIYANMFDKFARKDREWRFGWWDKDKPQVEEYDESEADKKIQEERRKEHESKKKFIELKLKEKKEAEEKARLEKEEQEKAAKLQNQEIDSNQSPPIPEESINSNNETNSEESNDLKKETNTDETNDLNKELIAEDSNKNKEPLTESVEKSLINSEKSTNKQE